MHVTRPIATSGFVAAAEESSLKPSLSSFSSYMPRTTKARVTLGMFLVLFEELYRVRTSRLLY